jgi:cyclic beta-1,2-glucan synthetase
VGRGGWTWYTGAAGWLYRAGLESILGIRLRGTELAIDPCVPRNWPSYSINFQYHSTKYQIKVDNPSGVSRGVTSITLDGRVLVDRANIPLTDDGKVHQVQILLGSP